MNLLPDRKGLMKVGKWSLITLFLLALGFFILNLVVPSFAITTWISAASVNTSSSPDVWTKNGTAEWFYFDIVFTAGANVTGINITVPNVTTASNFSITNTTDIPMINMTGWVLSYTENYTAAGFDYARIITFNVSATGNVSATKRVGNNWTSVRISIYAAPILAESGDVLQNDWGISASFANDTALNTSSVSTYVDTNNPVLNTTIPANNSYIQGTSSQWFNVSAYDVNLNLTNATVHYRQVGAGSWTDRNMPCSGTAPTFACANASDLYSAYAEGNVIQFYFEATDNTTHYASNGTAAAPLTATIDRTAPTYANWATNVSNDTTIRKGTIIGLSANWTDNYALGSYIRSSNETTSWVNQTSVAFSTGTWSNVSIDTSAFTNGAMFQAKIFVNDSAGNQNVTTIFQWTIDGTAPTYNNYTNTTNDTQISNQARINLTAQWNDSVQLNRYWLWDNTTGGAGGANETAASYAGLFSGTTLNWTNITLPSLSSLSSGAIVRARIFANDTSGNENSTLIFQWTIDNSAPQYSNNNTNSSTGYAKIIKLYSNWTDNIDLGWAVLETNETGTAANKTSTSISYGPIRINLTAGQSWSNFTWYNSSVASGTAIEWRIWVNDSTGNLNVTPAVTFIFDRVSPTITITTPVNNSYNNSLAGYDWINGTVSDDVAMSASGINVSIRGTNASSYQVYNFTTENNTLLAIENSSTTLSDGQFVVTIGYQDKAGNVQNTTVVFYKDTTAPSAVYGLTNSTSGKYRPNSTQVITVLASDALQTNQTATLNYYLSYNNTWLTATMTGTPNISTAYTTTIATSNLVTGQYVMYYITGTDNATNAIIAAVGGSASSQKGNLTIDIYCGNEGVALSFCSRDDLDDWNWRSVFLPPNTVVNSWSSLGGNRTVPKVFESISGSYNYVYYYNGSQWTAFDPSLPLGQSDLRYANQTNSNPYWVNMTSPGVIRIQ